MGFLIGLIFTFFIFLGANILVAFTGWKLTRKIKNDYLRITIRSAILSIAFAPTCYGPAGPMFALFAIFWVPAQDKFVFGFMPILFTWVISGGSVCTYRWLKNRGRVVADT